MARRGAYGIDDWAETVRETLSQLGGKKKPASPPRSQPKPQTRALNTQSRRYRSGSINVSSASRHRSKPRTRAARRAKGY